VQPSLGVTMFPLLVRAEMASKTVNANIELKSQVI
jgi:hypothetical protein